MVDVTEERLREAVLHLDEYELNRLRARTEPPHEFSRRFQRKMVALLRQNRRPPVLRVAVTAMKRAAVILLALITVSATTVVSVKALRERVFQWLMETYATHTDVSFHEQEPTGQGAGAFRPCAPAYLPEGFVWVNEAEYEESLEYEFVILQYEDKGGNNIVYQQFRIDQLGVMLNEEEERIEPIQVKNREGYYASNMGDQMVIWNDGDYVYYVSSNLNKETVLKIAESTKLIE